VIVIHQIQEFIAKLKSAHIVLFTKFLGNLDLVGMIMQISVQNSANVTIL